MEESMREDDGIADKKHLIVNYLPQCMKDTDLYTMFITQGPVDYVRIIKDFKTGYSFGFGFVKFKKAEDATKAIEALNGIEYYNKRLKVSYARPPSDDNKKCNLYVANLPKSITEDDIAKIFSEYGDIVSITLLKDRVTGMPRGIAFVRYVTRDHARNAIQNIHGMVLEGCEKPICVKVAEERGKQKGAYYEGWKAHYQMNPMNQVQMMDNSPGVGYPPNIGLPSINESESSHSFDHMMMGDGNMNQ